jgi:hypothetical protein
MRAPTLTQLALVLLSMILTQAVVATDRATVSDVLERIKVAYDQDEILDLGFYDEARLRQFFEPEQLKWMSLPGQVTRDANLILNKGTTSEIYIGVIRHENPPQDRKPPHSLSRVSAQISVVSRDITLQTVEKIFGSSGDRRPVPLPKVAAPLPPPLGAIATLTYGKDGSREEGVPQKFVTVQLGKNDRVIRIAFVDERN